MADKKSTIMVLKVDLHCCSCYKKIKKILSKFPQIRDQIFNEKANTVTINILCCDPEKLRDKLCCKGANVIKSIEIVEQQKKPKEPEETKTPEKPKEPEKQVVIVVEKPKEPEKPMVVVMPTVMFVEQPKEPEKSMEKPKEDPKPDLSKEPKSAPSPPPCDPFIQVSICPTSIPWGTCCSECYHGYSGGPCYNGYGAPHPQPRQSCYDGYEYSRPRRISRCDLYFSDENPQGCSIM